MMRPQVWSIMKYDASRDRARAKRPRHLPKGISNSSTAVSINAVDNDAIINSVMPSLYTLKWYAHYIVYVDNVV